MAKLDKQELVEDKKSCKKIGPCGVGKKALYLNSFYIDRRYYLPYGSISRVFKRVAMSSGGFTGKGMFASMAYLVVEYDGGKQKQCNFKDERDVDKLLEVLERLTDGGNTVLVIEHNLDVIKTADYLIDLGPEGGDKGGTLVCCGTPEEVAACDKSYTGRYLKPMLNK